METERNPYRPELLPADLIERQISRASLFREHTIETLVSLETADSIVDNAKYDPLLEWALDVASIDEGLFLQMSAFEQDTELDLAEDVKTALLRLNDLKITTNTWKAERLKRVRALAAIATLDMDVSTLKAYMAA